MRFAVAGGGVAGLASALAVARAGHTAVVIERDAVQAQADPHGAFDIARDGIAHFRPPHAFLPRGRRVLRELAPDVLQALLDGAEHPSGPCLLNPRGDLGYMGFNTFRGDNRTFAIIAEAQRHGGLKRDDNDERAARRDGPFCHLLDRRRPTLPGPCGPSTIGAEGLNYSVRKGKRCFPLAIATGNQ